MVNTMSNETTVNDTATVTDGAAEGQGKSSGSLFDGWNAPPNLVTYSRIVLVVIFLSLYITAGPWGEGNIPMRWTAAVLFILAASTDKLDGWMARKYHQVTELGKLMDPIADKLLTCGALIVAAAFGELGPVWLGWVVVALFLVREVGITVMRFFVMERPGGKVIAAAWPGKLKTLFQCIGLSMLMLPMWVLNPAQTAPMWMTVYYTLTYTLIYVALILCLYSGGVYLVNTFGKRDK
ncbi:CDP-diacylglycerol--glycerol-3-phosphate 3-phosphatidyltransferase [Bifidobacterium leontopitheci]